MGICLPLHSHHNKYFSFYKIEYKILKIAPLLYRQGERGNNADSPTSGGNQRHFELPTFLFYLQFTTVINKLIAKDTIYKMGNVALLRICKIVQPFKCTFSFVSRRSNS